MTKVYFLKGNVLSVDGPGKVMVSDVSVEFLGDDFVAWGDITAGHMSIHSASLDAKDLIMTDASSHISVLNGKIENINANTIWLWDGSSVSNASVNELETTRGNNAVEGSVSARVISFEGDATLAINGFLKVGDKSGIDFARTSGSGKIYDEKTHAYYDTNNKLLEYNKNIDLSALRAGDGNEIFSFDGSKLVLNKGSEFSLSGDGPAFITNEATILKADISGTALKSIKGSGSIKELHLSKNASFSLNCDFEKAVIDKNSMLTLFKKVDFSKLSGEGLVNINGTIYDTNGNALNEALNNAFFDIGTAFYMDDFATFDNATKYGIKITKAVEKMKFYIDEKQVYNVDLLNMEMINSDNLL